MICVSIQNKNATEITALLQDVQMAEIRLDSCTLSDEEIDEIFSSDLPLVATCRIDLSGLHESEHRLTRAIKAGARYADLEIEAPKPMAKRIAKACKDWGTMLIRSYHDYESTPDADSLRQMVDKCRLHDADLVKIVTTAKSEEDAARVLGLYKYYTAESLVAFAMGELGSSSRIECLKAGAPFSYACVSSEEATAGGQIPFKQMMQMVYGSFPVLKTRAMRMPASKSYAQRAIVAAALSDGESVLGGYSPCDDSEAAKSLALDLGAQLREENCKDGSKKLIIKGISASKGCLGQAVLNVGESGLLTRLMIPLAAQLFKDGADIQGRGTLLDRPLQGAAAAMAAMGAHSSCQAASSADLMVPLHIQGPLGHGRFIIDGSKSSQLISGALMAFPLSDKHISLSVTNPVSIPYIYMTMDILRKFGIKIRSEMYGGRALLDEDWSKCTEILLKVKENQSYKAVEFDLEGDWSAAAVFLAAGAVFGQTALTGLDTTSLQADLCMMDILMDAGASLSQLDEPKGLITVSKAPLQAITADLNNCPDLFPVCSVFCAFCQGRSTLKGVHRLAHKESDRAAAIMEMLAQAGVKAEIKGDDMLIYGESLESRLLNGRLLKGGSYSSHHDHRMVMALRLAELGADSKIEIDDTACVAKSYPQFNEIWNEYVRKQF